MSLEAADELIAQSVTPEEPKPRAFSASELVPCEACSRANPPTRGSCLYCGAALPVTELNSFAPPPTPETETTSESSFHVVALAPSQIEPAKLEQLAELLGVKPSELGSLLAHSVGAPLVTVNSENQAQLAAQKLNEQGVRTVVVSEKELAPARPPAAISAFEIHGDSVVGTVGRSKQRVAISWDQIILIVTGRLYFETREIDQKQNRAKQVIDEREMLADEAVMDVYARGDEDGWRIRAGNFDFSFLGEHKKLTTFENFTSLTRLLREHATAAAFDDGYVRLRRALDSVWPDEPGASEREKRRTAFGSFDSPVTLIDNELQFTRYSRLLRYLLESQAEDHAAQT